MSLILTQVDGNHVLGAVLSSGVRKRHLRQTYISSFFFSSSSTAHLVETGLGVEFAERGDDQWLGRALRLEVRSVGRNGLWVWQWAHL